jgi:YHS domain-containing protein
VKPGEATSCIVSGATLVVEASSPQTTVGDRTYYFCCASCLEYFEAHQADVLAKRGLSAS